jgi:hypothetical protein
MTKTAAAAPINTPNPAAQLFRRKRDLKGTSSSEKA